MLNQTAVKDVVKGFLVFFLLALWPFFVSGAVHGDGDTFTAQPLFIIDGDSIMVKEDRQKIEVRLWGIDSPEFDQPHADDAKKALGSILSNASLLLEVKDVDRYGRLVVVVWKGKLNINEVMVKNGHAWVHVRYCREEPCNRWFELENEARKMKIGIFRDANPVPPWKWKALKNRPSNK